jgi:uncharacterized membrane protein
MRPLRIVAMFGRLRDTYWFIPALLTTAAVGLGILLTAIDRVSGPGGAAEWVYGGGADGARALLSAIAGSMITVVSVTFSVLVVALTVSSQHFGPRLLRSFMRDRPAQLVLGTFTGTFAYCLVVLRTVQGDGGERFALFVPHLAVAGAIVLGLASVGVLIYYVHHVALAMQVSEITKRIAHELERTIDRLYPDPIGAGSEPPVRRPPPVPPRAVWLCAAGSGYVQQIESSVVLELAVRHRCTLWLTARPGDFVVRGDPIAAAHPPPVDAERLQSALASAYAIGSERTPHQDAAFAVQQLVEIALRALSPGTNEPFTAITVIDRLGQALSSLASRRIPSAERLDQGGELRVVSEPRTFEVLLASAFDVIAIECRTHPEVMRRLVETVERLGRRVRREGDRVALRRLLDSTWAARRANLSDSRQQIG